jgi:hypothetical protein
VAASDRPVPFQTDLRFQPSDLIKIGRTRCKDTVSVK